MIKPHAYFRYLRFTINENAQAKYYRQSYGHYDYLDSTDVRFKGVNVKHTYSDENDGLSEKGLPRRLYPEVSFSGPPLSRSKYYEVASAISHNSYAVFTINKSDYPQFFPVTMTVDYRAMILADSFGYRVKHGNEYYLPTSFSFEVSVDGVVWHTIKDIENLNLSAADGYMTFYLDNVPSLPPRPQLYGTTDINVGPLQKEIHICDASTGQLLEKQLTDPVTGDYHFEIPVIDRAYFVHLRGDGILPEVKGPYYPSIE